jgi:hypothetical protein
MAAAIAILGSETCRMQMFVNHGLSLIGPDLTVRRLVQTLRFLI